MEHQLQLIVTLLCRQSGRVRGDLHAGCWNQPRRVQLTSATTAAATVLVMALAAPSARESCMPLASRSMRFPWRAGVLVGIGFGMLRGSTSDQQRARGRRRDAVDAHAAHPVRRQPRHHYRVITLAVTHSKLGFPVTALVAVAVATAVLWLALMAAIQVAAVAMTNKKPTGRIESSSGWASSGILLPASWA